MSCNLDKCNEEGIPNLHEPETWHAVLQANKNMIIRQIGYHGDEMDSRSEAERGNLY
jgi:hypothetical protein